MLIVTCKPCKLILGRVTTENILSAAVTAVLDTVFNNFYNKSNNLKSCSQSSKMLLSDRPYT